MVKKGDFRHILEIYGLEQSFLGLKSLKNKLLGLIFYFLRLKSLKNKVFRYFLGLKNCPSYNLAYIYLMGKKTSE